MDEKIKVNKTLSIDLDFEELSANIDSPIDAIVDTLRDASSVGTATQAGMATKERYGPIVMANRTIAFM